MTAGAHDSGDGFGRSAGANAARGIAVIIGAILLGTFLMVRGVADEDALASTETTTTTEAVVDDAADDSSAAGGDTTDTTAPPADADTSSSSDTLGAQRNPAEVLTLAVNGTDPVQSGVAGRTRDVLQTNGYAVADPKNAETKGPSVVLFTEGYESDARAIAGLFGADPDAVVRPFDPATSPIADTQSANVIVMAGNDGVILP